MAIDYRTDYQAPPLDFALLAENPVEQFLAWFEAAVTAGLPEPNAMTVATVSPSGEPSARMLLLKSADARGFTFYTNYGSAKASDLDSTGRAALVFFWQPMHRQVRVNGAVTRVSRDESAEYFATRPRGAQIGAWASRQSSVLGAREELEQQVAAIEARFAGREIAVPEYWGGYRLVPERVEFWQGQPSRLHDRALYVLEGGTWKRSRLSP